MEARGSRFESVRHWTMEGVLKKEGAAVAVLDLEDLRAVFREFLQEWETESRKEEQGARFVSRDGAAEMLGVDVSTLWRWQKSGALVPLKAGSRVRYRESDVLKFMEG